MYKKLTTALLLLTSLPVLPADRTEYRKYFDDFKHLSSQFDTAVSFMYTDDARIIGVRKKPDGTEEQMTITGERWKSIILASMESAKQLNDRYEYTDINISVEADQAKISATRYSVANCFTDNQFYMIVKNSANDLLQIVEQFMESPAQSNCEGSKTSLEDYLKSTVTMINGQLPASIDSETQLVKTSSDGSNLTYHYVLLNYTSETLTQEDATSKLKPLVVQQSCSNPNLRSILDQDGSISYIYRGSDAVQIAKLDVEKSVCSK